MTKRWDAIWFNGTLATCEPDNAVIQQGAIAVDKGKIAWVGKMTELPGAPDTLAEKAYDLQNKLLTPGLVDCHTHTIYAGNRAHEFELRLQGVSYAEIAKQGGGIQSTVTATRAATIETLFADSFSRVRTMLRNGVTTLEIKSGYGLDWETEFKMLRVAKMLEEALPITIHKTFLGAHTIPSEYKNNPDSYVDLVCTHMLPKIKEANLADSVDVFCESIAFTLPQTKKIFEAATKLKLPVKCHSEQLSDSGSAALAAQFNALSADHLEFLSEQGVQALAKSGTVAVLLPGAFYYLRETKMPPIELLRKHKVMMAIATDCNPGTSPILSLLLIMNMACTLFKLSVNEVLLAVTLHAAKALGLEKSHGSLKQGKNADFVVWEVSQIAELIYYIGANPLNSYIKRGNVCKIQTDLSLNKSPFHTI